MMKNIKQCMFNLESVEINTLFFSISVIMLDDITEIRASTLSEYNIKVRCFIKRKKERESIIIKILDTTSFYVEDLQYIVMKYLNLCF
jgi:hypothetical protein